MRISRWYGFIATAALAAVVAIPTVASAALLTNEWGQSFAGKAVCVGCHAPAFNDAHIDYDKTSHGQFVKTTTATIEPNQASGMYDGLPLGGEVDPADVFTTGAGTGLREYLVFGEGTNGPFGVASLEWDPSAPSLWEVDGAATEIEFEDYACNQCHQLGATKAGVKPALSGATTGTANAWATFPGAPTDEIATWIPGASIQCERCHGTGVAASMGTAKGHWTSGVQIVGFTNEISVASTKLLKSEVCGQCHGSFKPGGNIAGFTPDKTITDFVPNQYTLADVPTAFSASAKFFPNGENKGLKHVYYTEWALSGHSVRGALTSSTVGAVTPYQASGASHYSSVTSTGGVNPARVLCNRCHTGEGYMKRKGVTIMSGWSETANVAGNLGQECAACHISHGNVGAEGTTANGEAVGMAVRAPEQANGQFSTLNLNVDNKSICEDCHNWQREVANAGTAPTLPAILGKYVSHPQREVYHGRAMLEIPAGEDFMPGAKCEQCHMPATKSDFPDKTGLTRYEDRSWKRYSHRMFIMEPGDAKAWGLAPWGDSCSPCHAGETQDQLQANIDTWQGTASDLADEASSAIAAAVTRGDATTAGDVDLLKRASANLSLFVQDSSEGAHNPTYEQAGLTKAAELAEFAGGSLSITAPEHVGNNSLFGIAGQALEGDNSAADGVTVTLWNGTTLLGTSVTDAAGNYGFAYATTADKTLTVKWERSSQSVSDLTASTEVEVIAPVSEKDASTITLTRSAGTITHGHSVVLSGVLSPVDANPASIRIQYKKPGSSKWVTWKYVTSSDTGAYTKTWSTGSSTARGTWSWRTYFGATDEFLGDWSNTVTVHVN